MILYRAKEHRVVQRGLLFAGCQDDESVRMVEEMSSFNQITVTPDILADTRAHLDNDIHVVWDENDTIGVYSDTDGVVPFVYSSGKSYKLNFDKRLFPVLIAILQRRHIRT